MLLLCYKNSLGNTKRAKIPEEYDSTVNTCKKLVKHSCSPPYDTAFLLHWKSDSWRILFAAFPLFHFPLFGTEEISYRKNQNVWDESNVFHPLFTAEQDALFTAESTASFLEFPFCFHLVQLNTASFSLPGIALWPSLGLRTCSRFLLLLYM